jgi:hypothetical protein
MGELDANLWCRFGLFLTRAWVMSLSIIFSNGEHGYSKCKFMELF